MSSKKLFFLLIACTILAVAGAATVFHKSIELLKVEGDKLVDLKLTNEVLSKQEENLTKAKRDISTFSELASMTKQIIPQEKNQASTIAEISSMANSAGIRLGSLDFPTSTLGEVQGRGSKNRATDPSKTQLTELPDMKGVYIMSISINSHKDIPSDYSSIIDFLKLLESSRKTSQVTDISITPDDDIPNKYEFQITINTYVRPE